MRFTLKAAKNNFFDRAAVLKLMSKAQARGMSAVGAAIRGEARKLMKPQVIMARGRVAKGQRRRVVAVRHSRPGEPPRYSGNPLLREKLIFAYDRRAESLVVGPAALKGNATVPRLLEEGGFSRSAARRAYYEPRPYMQPAFQHVLPRIPTLFAARVGGGP